MLAIPIFGGRAFCDARKRDEADDCIIEDVRFAPFRAPPQIAQLYQNLGRERVSPSVIATLRYRVTSCFVIVSPRRYSRS